MKFVAGHFGPVLGPLIEGAPLNELGPGARSETGGLRHALDLETAFPSDVVDADMARCVLAGVYLLYDNLDASHEISQSIETPSGSYWHAIMHRREPDYGNAKYWFRRVGDHLVFPTLLTDVKALAGDQGDISFETLFSQPRWDSYRFVDLCETAARKHGSLETLCRTTQRRECELLLDYCFQRAIGK